MNLTKNQTIIVLVAVAVGLLLLFVFLGVLPGLKNDEDNARRLEGDITMWGLFDEQSDYAEAINAFRRKYPNISVLYRGFNDEKEYRSTLLDSLAAGTGPDVFMIHNNDLYQDSNKIIPAPEDKLPLLTLRDIFPQVVEQDFAPQGLVYALPLSVDTLALLYNRDMLDAAAVSVPETWETFLEAIPKLLKFSSGKNIDRAAAAMGGSFKSIDRVPDILSLLMLQSGTKMTSDDFRAATFSSPQGVSAFTFYTQFADQNKSSYTWNDEMPHYLDALSREKVAMVLDYSSAISQIKFRNNLLNLGIAPAPQLTGTTKPLAYPQYWGYAVSRQTKRPDVVWDFVITMTTSLEVGEAYTSVTGRPPALRTLIEKYLDDSELGIFARQALIARSWPQVSRTEIGGILSNAVSEVNSRTLNPERALKAAETLVSELMAKGNQ